MTSNKLKQLYRTLIIEESKSKKNRGELALATHAYELLNPSCGDVILVQIQLEDGKVADILFQGEGCAISMASASIMCDLLRGQTLERANQLIKLFNQLMTGTIEKSEAKVLRDAQALSGVRQFPNRIRCATLAWKAFDKINESLDD